MKRRKEFARQSRGRRGVGSILGRGNNAEEHETVVHGPSSFG